MDLATQALMGALYCAIAVTFLSKNKDMGWVCFALVLSFIGAKFATFDEIKTFTPFLLIGFGMLTFRGGFVCTTIGGLYLIRAIFVGLYYDGNSVEPDLFDLPITESEFWEWNNFYLVLPQIAIALLGGLRNGGLRVRDVKNNFVSRASTMLTYVSHLPGSVQVGKRSDNLDSKKTTINGRS